MQHHIMTRVIPNIQILCENILLLLHYSINNTEVMNFTSEMKCSKLLMTKITMHVCNYKQVNTGLCFLILYNNMRVLKLVPISFFSLTNAFYIYAVWF